VTETMVRTTLWLAFPFNLLAATTLAFPSSALGQLMGLPRDVSPLYSFMVAFFIALFGCAYAWLARQRSVDRPLLALGSIGKFGAFLIALSLWFGGAVSGLVVVVAIGGWYLQGYGSGGFVAVGRG
jgi:hypothetical protein